tara:strand:+ start:1383 stop:1517 length:135 start_codon:yes stop_codon:yes gene_type:complete
MFRANMGFVAWKVLWENKVLNAGWSDRILTADASKEIYDLRISE